MYLDYCKLSKVLKVTSPSLSDVLGKVSLPPQPLASRRMCPGRRTRQWEADKREEGELTFCILRSYEPVIFQTPSGGRRTEQKHKNKKPLSIREREAWDCCWGKLSLSCSPMYRRDKLGKGPEEVKLQNASKQIVETVILQAVQQISEEDNKKENNQDRSVGQTLTTRRVHHEKK
ncbi:A-kinase anchor protein inhibitor 1 [Ranitomeya imitator]|uniref:A-kinase anchor protein inhibitor 1 n=1 Tax=Ranitomeya imitator TaxID=111125 RepID=UPI0037E8BE81